MVLSKRERIIAIVAALAVVVLVLDYYAIKPLMESSTRLAAERLTATQKLNEAGVLLNRETAMRTKWKEMVADGLKDSPGDAEPQVLHTLQDLAGQAHLNISSLRPERSTKGDVVREITVQTSGTGSMAAVSRFLYLVESAKIPLRITALQIGARREGKDDLALVARISTLYMVRSATPAKSTPTIPPAPAAPAEETEEQS